MDRTHIELLRSYLAKAEEKVRAARDLYGKGYWDDAISRAYYAAFHAAQAALLTEGQRADTHRGLVTLFGLLLVKTGKLDRRWGKFLANLKDDREAGDYEAVSYLDEGTARRALDEAEGFVAAIRQYVATLIGEPRGS
ncbi:HEPN domain-containing protein [Nitrospira sp. Kam-Ns4a]